MNERIVVKVKGFGKSDYLNLMVTLVHEMGEGWCVSVYDNKLVIARL